MLHSALPPSLPGCSLEGSNPAPAEELPLFCLPAPSVVICHPQSLLWSWADARQLLNRKQPRALSCQQGCWGAPGHTWHRIALQKTIPLHLDCSQNNRFPPASQVHREGCEYQWFPWEGFWWQGAMVSMERYQNQREKHDQGALKGRTISRTHPSHCFHVPCLSDQSRIKAAEWEKAAGDQS